MIIGVVSIGIVIHDEPVPQMASHTKKYQDKRFTDKYDYVPSEEQTTIDTIDTTEQTTTTDEGKFIYYTIKLHGYDEYIRCVRYEWKQKNFIMYDLIIEGNDVKGRMSPNKKMVVPDAIILEISEMHVDSVEDVSSDCFIKSIQ